MSRSCMLSLLFCTAALLSSACTSRGRPGRVDGLDGGTDGALVAGCDGRADADGDGVADFLEGETLVDLDSDGDGISDFDEHGPLDPCQARDSDGDGVYDWLDTDSDNDGLPDSEEAGTYFTDPRNPDSDGDGVTDLGEVRGTGTDPNDSTIGLPEGDFFVLLPYYGDEAFRELRFNTDIAVADIYFLIDTTGSMGGPITNVRDSLTTIAAEISSRIPDAQMGVGRFDDFPHGADIFTAYGDSSDVPYENMQDITGSVPAVQSALGTLSAAGGADGPESQVEALYQTATGEGASWALSTGTFNLPRRTCPTYPDERGRRQGYPCFRPGALPIVVLVADVVWHNGPGGTNAYSGFSPAPHTFEQAASALSSIGARFIGVAVNGGGRAEAEAMARATGTVDGAGTPLVYDAPAGSVSTAIIDGISTITGGVVQDVTTRTESVAGNPGDFDATLFIKAITPMEGYDRSGIPGAGYSSKDEFAFYGVVPGTDVEFRVRFYNDVRSPSLTAEIYRALIVVVGNGVATLDTRNVYIVVPPEGGTVLI